MKALVYHGPGQRGWDTVDDPTIIDPTDVKLIVSGQLDPTLFATHRFALEDTMAAYDTFADAANSGALKVALCGPESTSTPTETVATAATAV